MEISLKQIIDAIIYMSIGLAIATPLTLLNVRLAPSLGLIDWPKARGLAEDQVPIIGHSLVLFSFIVLVLINQFYPGATVGPWILLTSVIIGLMGHFDDRKPLSAADKLFIQALCIGIVLLLDEPLRQSIVNRYGIFGMVFTGVFVLGMVNAVNFIDGIDGLAGMVMGLGGISLALLSKDIPKFYGHFIYGNLLVGMVVPFLYLNIRRRRGFMGNVGSYFLSFLLINLHLSLPIETDSVVTRLSLTGLCFIVPIADSLMVITARLITLRSPFQPDKGHLHHRLVQSSLPLRWVLCAFGLIEVGALVLVVLLVQNPALRTSTFAAYLCISHIAITTMLILLIDGASRRRVRSYIERLDGGEPIYYFKYEMSHLDGSPITSRNLKRIEARISAEIRVTDFCFIQNEKTVFVVLKSMPEPLKGISARLETVFQAEKVNAHLAPDQGEFVKLTRDLQTLTLRKSA